MKTFKHFFSYTVFLLISLAGTAQTYKVITVPSPGELENTLGEDWNKIDSIVVKGTVNKEDFKTLYNCSRLGKLTVINLEGANIVDNKIPDFALFYPDTMLDYLDVQRIILPENVTEIGEYAFSNMFLKKINFPSSLKKFSKGSFCGCHWMEVDPLVIPEGITEIPWECFAHCQSFRKLVLPKSLKILAGFSFYNTRMNEMNLPQGLDSIGTAAFWSSYLLRNVVIPESAIHLGIGAFAMTDSLRNINIPKGITQIPDLFLAYSYKIDSITIPEGVTSIGNSAFQWDYDLSYIKLPKNLKSIGFYAFEATNIEEIVLPKTLEFIGSGAFFRLDLLKRVYSLAKNPPTAKLDPNNDYDGPFYWSGKNCTLYVPVGSGDLYRNASGWQDFYKIEETDKFPSACGITFAPSCTVSSIKGGINVNNLTNAPVEVKVYNTNGSMVQQQKVTESCNLGLAPGIYVVKTGNKTHKVIVK